MNILGLIIFAVIFIAACTGCVLLAHEEHRYRYAERNPARRWCRKCGQREELYGMNWAEGFKPTGWEIMYPIVEKPCNYHERLLNELEIKRKVPPSNEECI